LIKTEQNYKEEDEIYTLELLLSVFYLFSSCSDEPFEWFDPPHIPRRNEPIPEDLKFQQETGEIITFINIQNNDTVFNEFII